MVSEVGSRSEADQLVQSVFINSMKENAKGTRAMKPEELDGLLIGVMGEVVSKLPMNEMETIVGDSSGKIRVVSQKEIPGLNMKSGTKGEILTKALEAGFQGSKLDEESKREYISGMGSWMGKRKEEGWSFQNETTIPDGWVVNNEEKLSGLMDVKAYSNEEIRAIVEGGGVGGKIVSRERFFEAINGMVNMYVLVKRQSEEIKPEDESLDLILRFPKDADDVLLKQLAEVMNRDFWGNESWKLRLTIQRLPLTRQQMLEKGKEIMKEQWEILEHSKLSDRNKEVLRQYLGIDSMEVVEEEKMEREKIVKIKAVLRAAVDGDEQGFGKALEEVKVYGFFR